TRAEQTGKCDCPARSLIALCLWLGLAQPLWAETIAQEDYSYPVGELIGRHDGDGWRSPWCYDRGLTKFSGENNLKVAYPGPDYADLGRAERTPDASRGGLLSRGIANPSAPGKTYYISFTIQKTAHN